MVTAESPLARTASALQEIYTNLRAGQQQMADWQGGPLAVSAVPGSGKSTGMAGTAAILLGRRYGEASHRLPQPRQQLVVVTFTRSAANNIRTKIRNFLRQANLPPIGFAVHTLHGLALSIASSHPERSGLNLEQVTLLSPNKNHSLIRTCVEQWIAKHPSLYQQLLEGQQFDGEETERLRRQSVLRTEVLPDLAQTAIHEAKSSGLTPDQLRQWDEETHYSTVTDYPVLTIAAGLYDRYQALLQTRNLIDYDDMILAALKVLETETVRELWQRQVMAVFEDEAQDSTPLQTRLLEILAADSEQADRLNWIRIGDPNQAINSTFTPADPIFFRDFCETCSQQQRLVTMTQAGRSAQIIMDAANFMLEWVNSSYQGRFQPFRPQSIQPVPPDDPQANANPPAVGAGLELQTPPTIHQTVEQIGQRIIQLFRDDPAGQAAVLVRENKQGQFVAAGLQPLVEGHDITVYEVGQHDRHSRVPAEVLTLLKFIDRPHSPDGLKAALRVLMERQLIPSQDLNAIATLPEQILYPGPLDPKPSEAVLQASQLCYRLIRTKFELPTYQLIPFLALTLDYDRAELATADKLAERLNRQMVEDKSLQALITLLSEIVGTERFEPVDPEDPEQRYTKPKQVTIITMHKAKGLDWDYVFIPFLHEVIIPGSQRVPPQTKFLGDFTLAEVARAQIRHRQHNPDAPPLTNETAWEQAGRLKTAEEFRLLYVAMTRAKRLLWMSAARQAPFTWNKPENLQDQPTARVFTALQQQFLRELGV